MKRRHSTAELVRESGVTYRQLRRWVIAGLVPAPVLTSAGPGHGVVAQWSAAAMRRVRAIRAMRRAGCPMSDILKRWQGRRSEADSEGGIPPSSGPASTS